MLCCIVHTYLLKYSNYSVKIVFENVIYTPTGADAAAGRDK